MSILFPDSGQLSVLGRGSALQARDRIGYLWTIGIASAYATIWFAAKIFKVGLLMHGKAPDLATLIRWAKAA